jgi:hypothetical protein
VRAGARRCQPVFSPPGCRFSPEAPVFAAIS